jgi:hypothetical protein
MVIDVSQAISRRSFTLGRKLATFCSSSQPYACWLDRVVYPEEVLLAYGWPRKQILSHTLQLTDVKDLVADSMALQPLGLLLAAILAAAPLPGLWASGPQERKKPRVGLKPAWPKDPVVSAWVDPLLRRMSAGTGEQARKLVLHTACTGLGAPASALTAMGVAFEESASADPKLSSMRFRKSSQAHVQKSEHHFLHLMDIVEGGGQCVWHGTRCGCRLPA